MCYCKKWHEILRQLGCLGGKRVLSSGLASSFMSLWFMKLFGNEILTECITGINTFYDIYGGESLCNHRYWTVHMDNMQRESWSLLPCPRALWALNIFESRFSRVTCKVKSNLWCLQRFNIFLQIICFTSCFTSWIQL